MSQKAGKVFDLLSEEPSDHPADNTLDVLADVCQLCPVVAKDPSSSSDKVVPKHTKPDSKITPTSYIEQLLAQHKKCVGCCKHKPLTDFHEGKGKCNGCFNDRRSLLRLSDSQKCRDVLDDMETNDEKQFDSLVKTLSKARDQAKKTRSKMKLSIRAFRESYKSESGLRKQNIGEFMWIGEYIEFCKTVKMGSLSAEEGRLKWEKMVDDKKVQRDNEGPRGMLRLAIQVSKQIIDYEDIARVRELEQSARVNKNASKEQLNNIINHGVLANNDEDELLDFCDLKLKAGDAFAKAADANALDDADSGGVVPEDVMDMLDNLKKKGKKAVIIKT